MNAAVVTPVWCTDAWVMHQLFRKLGFPPDDIYFGCQDTLDAGPNCVVVSVKQGELEFIVNLGHVETDHDTTCDIWQSFAAGMNDADDTVHQAIWDASYLQQTLPRMELILRLNSKGFKLPHLTPSDAAALRSLRSRQPDPTLD